MSFPFTLNGGMAGGFESNDFTPDAEINGGAVSFPFTLSLSRGLGEQNRPPV
jgi:hypothetical protein